MKFRNKETGEIRKAEAREDGIYMYYEYLKQWYKYDLLVLAERWEYYEEPKEFWSIDQFGEPINVTGLSSLQLEKLGIIGNLFESEEKTERAVEKLKAFNRLGHKGFRFDGYDVAHNGVGDLCGQAFYNAGKYSIEDVEADLDLLFGGEDEA